jgi:type I restriction enzyme S subunit
MSAVPTSVSLHKVAALNPPLPQRPELDELVSFLPMSAVDAGAIDVVDHDTRRFADVSKGYTPFVADDVLVAKITPCFENGKIAQAKPTHRFAFGSTEFHVVRSDRDALDPRYLAHFLRQDRIRLEGQRKMTGSAGQRRVPEHFLASLQIPLPPLPEQRRIAAILDKAEALRAKRRAAIQKLDELTQSIFLDMFGDPATNPKSWPNQSLDELFDIARGGSPRPIDAFITEADDGVNWIMIGDTTEGGKYITRTRKRIKPEGVSRSRMVKPGDFLLTNSMSFGRPYILQTSGCIHDGWLVLSPRSSGFESDYFYTLLGSRAVYAEFQRRASGATVKNLNIELVHGVRVPVAPASEQKRFAASVACIEDARRQLVSASSRLDDLFASLQQRAFRGEL